MKKQQKECECCGKEIRMYFCPRCKSHQVFPVQGWRNAFGIIPKWRCKKCGFENMTFPMAVYGEKTNKKLKGRKK